MFISTSMYLALSVCLLFFSLTQSVNDAQLLNTTSLFLLFEAAAVPGMDYYNHINLRLTLKF